MNPILSLQSHEFCIIFPKGNSINLFATQNKCEQYGVATTIEEDKQIFHYVESDLDKNTVSEREVKAWINAQGETLFFENKRKKDFVNWKKLLDSEQEESIALALTLLNNAKRPQPKYFALWLALGSLHIDERIRETGEMMVLQYLTEEEWKMFHQDKIESTIIDSVREGKKIPDFVDINYVQFWAEIFVGGNAPFFKRSIILRMKGFDKVWKEPEFKKILKKMSVVKKKNKPDEIATLASLYIAFEEGDDLTYLKKISAQFLQINALYFYRKDTYQLSKSELKLMNCKYLILDKFLFPKEKISFKLDRVEYLEWIYPEAINFLGKYFPNIYHLDLLGTVVEEMDISQNVDKLTELILCLKNQKTLPLCIYDCKKLVHLHIHNSVITKIDESIKRLRKVDLLCLKGTKFEEFPIEFFLMKKLDFMVGLDAPQDDLRLGVYKKLPGGRRIMFDAMGIEEFPYYLAQLPQITFINLECNKISGIDDRITAFENLESIILYGNELTELPDSVLKNTNLKEFRAVANQITNISFDWISFANRQGVTVDLFENPIQRLPSIPIDFDRERIEKDKGKILVDKKSISAEQIELYQSIFGAQFIG